MGQLIKQNGLLTNPSISHIFYVLCNITCNRSNNALASKNWSIETPFDEYLFSLGSDNGLDSTFDAQFWGIKKKYPVHFDTVEDYCTFISENSCIIDIEKLMESDELDRKSVLYHCLINYIGKISAYVVNPAPIPQPLLIEVIVLLVRSGLLPVKMSNVKYRRCFSRSMMFILFAILMSSFSLFFFVILSTLFTTHYLLYGFSFCIACIMSLSICVIVYFAFDDKIIASINVDNCKSLNDIIDACLLSIRDIPKF
jgi:hypothetical protein